jgi:diguanylate cyclase (GGDEF)-like protein
MKAIRSPSIRSRLVLLVIACIAPAALMAVLLISYDYYRAREQLVHDSVMTARAMASVLDKEFAIVEATLIPLAMSPNLTRSDLSSFYDQAHNVPREHSVINIVLADADGRQLINTLRPFGAPLPQLSKIPPLIRGSETGKPAVSNLFIGQVSKRPTVAIGVPVHRGSDVVYTLSSNISTERFGKLLAQQNLPPDWIASILDKSGTIVARTHEMQRFVGQKSAPSLMSRIAKVKEDAFEGTTVDGTPVLGVFSRASNSEWTVVIGIPAKNLSTDLNRRFFWLIFATLTLLGGSLFVAWMIGGRIARSVRGLAVPARALGAGKTVEFQSFNLRETDEVGMALARASEMLLEAQYKANHDVLTGLANRALLKEILDQRLALCQRNSTCLSVLYVDLDGFKKINDEHGHATGDKLLKAVSQRFKSEIRKSDITARLGGDEFAIVLSDTPVTEAAHVAAKLIDSLSVPYQIGNLTVEISASIGVAGFPHSGATSKALLHRADDAMYEAKATGKGRVTVVTD